MKSLFCSKYFKYVVTSVTDFKMKNNGEYSTESKLIYILCVPISLLQIISNDNVQITVINSGHKNFHNL